MCQRDDTPPSYQTCAQILSHHSVSVKHGKAFDGEATVQKVDVVGGTFKESDQGRDVRSCTS